MFSFGSKPSSAVSAVKTLPNPLKVAANAAKEKEKWVTYTFNSGIKLQIANLKFVKIIRKSSGYHMQTYYTLTCSIKYSDSDGKEHTEDMVPLSYTKDPTGLMPIYIGIKPTDFYDLNIIDDKEAERFSKQLDYILSIHEGGKRRNKRTRHRKGKKPQRSRKNRR